MFLYECFLRVKLFQIEQIQPYYFILAYHFGNKNIFKSYLFLSQLANCNRLWFIDGALGTVNLSFQSEEVKEEENPNSQESCVSIAFLTD